MVFFWVRINSGIFLALELIPVFLIGVFFQPENKYGIFHTRKINTVFIFALDSRWTAAGQWVDRASGQSGQKSVHLCRKKLSDFNRLSLTLFNSVRPVQYRKFRYFSKWLKFLYFFIPNYYIYILFGQ